MKKTLVALLTVALIVSLATTALAKPRRPHHGQRNNNVRVEVKFWHGGGHNWNRGRDHGWNRGWDRGWDRGRYDHRGWNDFHRPVHHSRPPAYHGNYYPQRVVVYQSPPPVYYYQPPTVIYQPPVTYQAPVMYQQPPTIYQPPAVYQAQGYIPTW